MVSVGQLDMKLREDVRRQLFSLLEGASLTEEQLDVLVGSYASLVERGERQLLDQRRSEKRLVAGFIGCLLLVALSWWTIGRSPVVRLNEDSADAVLEVPKLLGWEHRIIRYWEVPPDDWDFPGWYYRTAAAEWAPLLASESADAAPNELR
jgi:hypothetical protein